jgi:uncharacterized protein YcgL (UPF0745 family)
MIIMAIHVDDCYIIGKKESIEKVKKQIEANGLKWKMTEDPKDYLSCELKFSEDKSKSIFRTNSFN